MKHLTALSVTVLIGVVLLSSCTSMRAGSPVKAGYDVDEPSWALRHIPGLQTLSNLIPPPTEARTKWDDWQKKKDRGWDSSDRMP